MLEYNFKSIEKKWQKYWQENKTFQVNEQQKNDKTFYCLDMFPYPSGDGLHVGHPVGYIASDIFSRYKRMNGFNVLHPMGWDSFGLPAEQHAIKTGKHPYISTIENSLNYKRQMNLLGLSYDWSREIWTSYPDYYKWTQWIFLKLFNSWYDPSEQKAKPIDTLKIPESVKVKGEFHIKQYQSKYRLVYFDRIPVNWCPELGTVLANEEVYDGKSEQGYDVIRKPMNQVMMRITAYSERLLSGLDHLDWPLNIKEIQRNWIGRTEGVEIDFKVKYRNQLVTVFTTRPETILGVTYIAIAPEHKILNFVVTDEQSTIVNDYIVASKNKSDLQRTIGKNKTGVFTGSYALNPINNVKIPIYIADYVLPNYGTGAVMGVPSHDERDFEFANNLNLPKVAVIIPENESDDKEKQIILGKTFWAGNGRMICNIKNVISTAENIYNKSNLEASKIILNILLKDNIGRVKVFYKMRDWIFSRQRYWGEPIPLIHMNDGTVEPIDENELPLILPMINDFNPTENGEPPLSRCEQWINVMDSKGNVIGKRESSTMPQWAGSCWYPLRFMDPFNTSKLLSKSKEQYWKHVNLYIGGAEHAVLHLLYARFWYMVLYDLDVIKVSEPFPKLLNQGMLVSHAFQDERGVLIPVDQVVEQEENLYIDLKTGKKVFKIMAKMSKSLRNVVNPDDFVEEHGADALRVYLMFMGPLEAQRIWDTKTISGANRFLRKIWNCITSNSSNLVPEDEEEIDLKIILNRTIKKVSEDIESLSYNTAISELMKLLNEIHNKHLSKSSAESILKLVSPFAPHISEELWHILGNNYSIALSNWPTYDNKISELSINSENPLVIMVNGKKKGIIFINTNLDDTSITKMVIEFLSQKNLKISLTDRVMIVKKPSNDSHGLVNVILAKK